MDELRWWLCVGGALLMGCLYAMVTAWHLLGMGGPEGLIEVWRELIASASWRVGAQAAQWVF